MVGSEIIDQPTRIKLPSCIPGTALDFHETATYDRYLRMKQAALGGSLRFRWRELAVTPANPEII